MRSPNWNESELKLALDLYLNKDLSWFNRMSDKTFEIEALSKILNGLDYYSEKPENFRSPGSIRMKLANFLSLDERYKKQSLGNGSISDRKLWMEYSKNPKLLHLECEKIISEHLATSNEEIREYIDKMNLKKSVDINIEKDFAQFAKSLKRTFFYYEEMAKNSPQNEYSKKIVECSKKVRKSLDWTDNIDSIPLDFETTYKEHPGINLKPIKNRKTSEKREEQTKEKIGKFVQRTFAELVEQDKLTDDIIAQLQTHNYSKNYFGLKPSFLIKIDKTKDLKEQIKDINGYVRYWTKPITIHKQDYCICKEWFENQREKYTTWLKSVNVPPFYMLKPKELKKLLVYLKEKDSDGITILRKDIIKSFPTETIEVVLDIMLDKGILAQFQGSSRELVIDDYDALFKMLNNPKDYSGE